MASPSKDVRLRIARPVHSGRKSDALRTAFHERYHRTRRKAGVSGQHTRTPAFLPLLKYVLKGQLQDSSAISRRRS